MSLSGETDNERYNPTANEPGVHPLIKGSFAFVPSAGMRLSPEILVLELFREVFFADDRRPSNKEVDPEEVEAGSQKRVFSDPERAFLHAMRGRRKKTKKSKTMPFFAPLYPELARQAWFGRNRERVIVNFLLQGPLTQHFWYKGSVDGRRAQRDEFVGTCLKALLGHRTVRGPHQSMRGKDISSIALVESNGPLLNLEDKGRETLTSYLDSQSRVFRIDRDELADRIANDFLEICSLEARMPRMEWIKVLMTFLRFALPMWLLAQMRITTLLHDWLLAAVGRGQLPTRDEMSTALSIRNRSLLRPSITPTREIFARTETYMKHRVELSILLYELELLETSPIKGKTLTSFGGTGAQLSVDKLLLVARELRDRLMRTERVQHCGGIQTFLIREAEAFGVWRNPLNKGQGKNIDEFFRILYRDPLGDEAGGSLLLSEGYGNARGFRVFPGQMLLKVVTYLSAQAKTKSDATRGGGKLVLEDVEGHFRQYGVDFTYAADARPLLVRELQAMGLLTGSPDAGGSVTVSSPY